MKLNKNSALLKRLLSDDEVACLDAEVVHNPQVFTVLMKLLRGVDGSTTVSIDDANWTIKRASKDGQDRLVSAISSLLGE